MTQRRDVRVLVRLGFVTLSVGVVTLVWELLALQAPYTPASISSLAAPVAQLRNTAMTTGLIALVSASALPHVGEELPRWWRIGVCVAVTAMLLALTACAAANLMGIQLHDPQPSASLFVYARLVTQGIASLFVLDLARRAFTAP